MTAIAQALAASRAVAMNEPAAVLMARTYRALRELGKPASVALTAAREMAATGKSKWPKGTHGYGNAAWGGAGEKPHMRWIESPSAAGLRFVGYADELVRTGGNGYYTDDDCGDTVRGVVYQMAARDGCPVFVAGYDNADNGKADRDGPAAVSFDELFIGEQGDNQGGGWSRDYNTIQALRDAARAADGIAERMAEEAREYSEASNAASRHYELGEEIANYRRAALDLLAERRASRAMMEPAQFPAMCRALTQSIHDLIGNIRDARAERAELFRNFGRHAGWGV